MPQAASISTQDPVVIARPVGVALSGRMSAKTGGAKRRLCLFHMGVVKPVSVTADGTVTPGRRIKLLPFKCEACLDVVLRGDADEITTKEILCSNDLWTDEEERLP